MAVQALSTPNASAFSLGGLSKLETMPVGGARAGPSRSMAASVNQDAALFVAQIVSFVSFSPLVVGKRSCRPMETGRERD